MAIKVTAQTKSAGRGVSVGGLANAWANPNNIAASDNADASIAVATSAGSDELWADSFNFALTDPISVCGIRVNFEVAESFAAGTSTFGFRLIKAGVEVGSVCARSVAGNTTDHIVSAGASGQLWGTTFTEAEVEASGFGVSLNISNTFGTILGLTVDHVQMTVHYSVEGGFGVASGEWGHEWSSVDTVKNLVVVGAEFGREFGSPSIPNFDPETEFGYDSGSPALTQLGQTLGVQSFERGHEWSSTLAYDSLIGTSPAEFSHEWGSSRTFSVSNLDVTNAEFGWEMPDPSFRYFEGGYTPVDRTVPGGSRAGTRRIIGNSGNRRVVVYSDRNRART